MWDLAPIKDKERKEDLECHSRIAGEGTTPPCKIEARWWWQEKTFRRAASQVSVSYSSCLLRHALEWRVGIVKSLQRSHTRKVNYSNYKMILKHQITLNFKFQMQMWINCCCTSSIKEQISIECLISGFISAHLQQGFCIPARVPSHNLLLFLYTFFILYSAVVRIPR